MTTEHMNKKIGVYSLYFKCKESYKILKEFVSFLKRENIIHEYISNLKYRKTNVNHRSDLFDLNEIKQKNLYAITNSTLFKCGAYLVSCAFNWENTKEGFAFWSRINHKWSQIFIEKYNKGD